MNEQEKKWFIFVQNREAVLEGLRQGQCDGILPAARGFLDGFAGFLEKGGVLPLFEAFPDHRQRRSISPFFFCHTLVYRPLFHLPNLAAIGDTLFRSPYILRLLGFNARQIEEGFYATEGQKPFDVESIAEFFALASDEDFYTYQLQWLETIQRAWPEVFAYGLWVLDSVSFSVPRGARGLPEGKYKVCILGVWQEGEVWPMVWRFAAQREADLQLGQMLVAQAQEVLGEGVIRCLLPDRGFLDGAWISELYEQGITVIIKVRSDMDIFEDLQGLARLPDTVWEEVPPPKNHKEPAPKREITAFSDLESWSSCRAPLCGCLIRDSYDDHEEYQAVVITASAAEAQEIYRGQQKRWDIEEVFMALTRYWHFDRLPPCRRGVAWAMVHFALLAFTLLGIYLACTGDERRPWSPPPLPMPERELAVYVGPYFALLLPSELLAIILENYEAWQHNKERVLEALRLCEGKT